LVWLVSQEEHEDPRPEELLERVPALKVTDTWQRIHNGKWVIGISICNKGKR
jgi:hypothetical protein